MSIIEVLALCGFIFGVACKLPPSLTIFLMNGCFCFPTFCYLIQKLLGHTKKKILNCRCCNEGYESIPTDDADSSSKLCSKFTCIYTLTTTLELLGFLIQFCVLVIIPVLLSKDHLYVPSGKAKHYITATYILVPVSLWIISIVWSAGWIQKWLSYIKCKTARPLLQNDEAAESASELPSDHDKTRLKAGS